jgi:hypothetical protein
VAARPGDQNEAAPIARGLGWFSIGLGLAGVLLADILCAQRLALDP